MAHAGFALVLDDIDLTPYSDGVPMREAPYAAMLWSNKGGDVDTWYRQRRDRTDIKFVVRKIVTRKSKRGFMCMVAVGTMDGRPRNVVLSDPFYHKNFSLLSVRELSIDAGKRTDHDVRIVIPCTAYSSKRA